ncbi:phosphotransferase enzyme family protein [Streptomyces sp. LE64]|uniref:phosphotransferase enzyme family protein n=1 Tax=Streptomyces sp. LE64 TaxID=3448653 RepID=UPI0040425A8E
MRLLNHLPDTIDAWARGAVGAFDTVREVHGRRAPGTCRVWELTRPDRSTRFIVKVARNATAYRTETFAYRHAVPAVPAGGAPLLLDCEPAHFALLLTAVPGHPLRELRLPPTEEREAYRRAGALLARIHTAGELTPQRRAAVQEVLDRAPQRLERLLHVCGDRVGSRERALLRALVAELPHLGPLPIAFVHGDAQPRNLMWSAAGRAAWIDFERARFAPAVQDFVRLAAGPWADRPALRSAFLAGYGRRPGPVERHALRCFAALDAAGALVWGAQQGDAEIVARGRRTLARLTEGEFA